MRLTSPASLADFNPFQTRTQADASHNLGDFLQLNDGRAFRYIKAGGSNISKGKLQLAPAPKANHHNVVVATAAASGDKTVTVTLGATAAVLDEYAEGFMAVNDVDGEGQTYGINGHPAANASASLALSLFDPVATALTTSSEVTLVHNAYNGVVEGTAVTRRGAGVPLVAISAGDYGWGQTKGVAATLCDTATTLGAPQIAGAVAGSVKDQTDILGASSEVTVAWADILAGVDTEYRPVSLKMD